MKRLIRNIIVSLLVIGVVVLCPIMSEAKTVTLNTDDVWVSGNISNNNTSDFYQIKITKPGRLYVTLQGQSVGEVNWRLMNADKTKEYFDTFLLGASNNNPVTRCYGYWLEAGTYWLNIYQSHRNTGGYRVRAYFSEAGNNEVEPNNSFSSAVTLSPDTIINGLISEDDAIDVYKITLPSSKTFMFSCVSKISRCYFKVWDNDYRLVYEDHITYGSENDPTKMEKELALSAGTYYVQIVRDNGDTGRYILKYAEVRKVSAISISGNVSAAPGESFYLKANISPGNATYKQVEWSSDDRSKATVDEDTGEVTIKSVGMANITARATDGSKVSKTITVIGLPYQEEYVTLTTKKRSKNQICVEWGYQFDVSGYEIQYSTNKSFKNAKIKRSTKLKLNLKKLKHKKRYYVRVRAYIKHNNKRYPGPWSKVKSKVVKY